ncbi:MAG: 4Fe-4S binding protein [Oscillospiraceae bacterium]|nr:4Fe-4S binding protein [Oscillospiraceae bacterium]MDD3833741.1 4Fe-4S binding protein [Oscillospiraceae bacterium]MDD4546948.1 4Fe-4S binding protein [Oscillospiraceae bacterium]
MVFDMIDFIIEKCQGCGLCVEICPKKLLLLDKSKVNGRGHTPVAITDKASCSQCALCAMMCPDCVIIITNDKDN